MSASQLRLYTLAIGLGVIYLLLLPLKPYPLGWLLKPLPMLIFAALAWRAFPGAAGRWLALGYVGAAAGDFFLDFGNRDGLFVQALLAFLVNQLAFVVAFALLGRGRPWLLWRSLPVVLYSLVMAAWMLPAAGALKIPVAIYLSCLLAMAILAGRLESRPGPLWLGAMLFVVADSLIGVNKFVQPFPYAVLVIVTCYFSGQALIAWGLLRLRNAAPTPATMAGVARTAG
ncbi:lysoplasmalogenase [Pseudomonas sp. Gutcm_11s]|uniref:lysoplasmalogenase n=1 Tax=Pseudomonas sp. Gutcm_11s TaxID=3026088 RepID=UPI0023627726|nr:lysoplasmalogenase [Pseudomonas sp. Gutcm_11s]MDD0842237.1 lysoplasmalogenase [Pseudomonas sp. Gutcm_11s]